jgi:hypothetical protein
MSVVPMIAIQFGVYEALKAQFMLMNKERRIAAASALRKKGMFPLIHVAKVHSRTLLIFRIAILN